MLPSIPEHIGSLADVMPSSLLSLRGQTNSLRLPAAQSAVIVMIDGLGYSALRGYSGHARELSRQLVAPLLSTVPSTTASAITTLTTGVLPGQHGMLGYRIREPLTGTLRSQLSDWDEEIMVPERWQQQPTLFEGSESSVRLVMNPKFSGTGFSRAALRGGVAVPVKSVAERFRAAAQQAEAGGLVYLYVSELDTMGHKHGLGSSQWLQALEEINDAFAGLCAAADGGTGVLLTADHGMINVAQQHQITVTEASGLAHPALEIAGEPRALHLYFGAEFPADKQGALIDAWRAAESSRAWIFTRQELIDSGLLGSVTAENSKRIGDLVVFARDSYAYYPEVAVDESRKMVGQHGSLTPEELQIPLVLAGAYA